MASKFARMVEQIDVFSEPIVWYIHNSSTHGTIAGGARSILVIITAIFFLIYTVVLTFTDRPGTFVTYDVSDTNAVKNLTYFDEFDFLFYVTIGPGSNNIQYLNTSIAKAIMFEYSWELGFTKQMDFELCENTIPNNISDKLIYCINKDKYIDANYTYTLPTINRIVIGSSFPFISILPVCELNCTDDEFTVFNEYLGTISQMYGFIKYNVAAPLDFNNPVTNVIKFITFQYSPTNTISIMLKSIIIESDLSAFPYMPLTYNNFTTYSGQDLTMPILFDGLSICFILEDAYSNTTRKYQKLDTLLASFIGVFNTLRYLGIAMTYMCLRFDKEFYMYNNIIREKIYEVDGKNFATQKSKQDKKFEDIHLKNISKMEMMSSKDSKEQSDIVTHKKTV